MRQRLAVQRRRRAWHTGVAGDRAHGRRGVAREYLQVDPLSGEERDCLAGVGPEVLREQHEADRLQISG